MKVLFNADDFGLTKGVSDGIIMAHTHGIVHSTTLMMNGLATDYAIRKAKEHPTLKTGIHLVLSYGRPLLESERLTDKEGNFKFTSVMDKEPDAFAVKREWQGQIEAFLATGLTLHHIDSHHHVHGWLPLKEVVLDLAKEYHVPVRYTDTLKDSPNILLTEALWTGFYADGVNNHIFEDLSNLHYHSVEVMTHPAMIDKDLPKVSSYVENRKKELDILCQLDIPDWIELV